MSIDNKISEAFPDIMTAVSQRLTEVAGEPVAFLLVAFNPNDGGRVNYATNAPREGVLEGLEVLKKQWATGEEDVPSHELN